MINHKPPFIGFLTLFCCLSLHAEDTATPNWLERAGSLRSSDPALVRGRGVIEWRPYSTEAFEAAAREHKMIFLFVTAPWCHAGAEMERKVFSDPQTADRLNHSFIPVRLERDKFPETDLRLQQAVSRLKNVRGWPLCAFMTGDGELFYGATTLALVDDPELAIPGMPSLLDQLLNDWRADRTRISREARAFCLALRRTAEEPSFRASIPPGALDAHAKHMQSLLDTEHGGFRSSQPVRFPAPRALDACLAHYAETGDEASLRVATVTLDAMLNGGIYDQLDGGFHRMSIDPLWRVPRFEKFPAMNAELILVLLHAFQVTHDGRYASAAEQTLRGWLKTLDANHLFIAASIAPAARSFEDGQYYTWTVRELELLFPDERDVSLARAYFGISDTGNQPTTPLRSVLTRSRPLADCAKEIGLPLSEAAQRLQSIRETMLDAREHRPRPALDHTPLCDANALFVCALLEAGRVLNRDEFTRQGVQTLKGILAALDSKTGHVLDDATSVPLASDLSATALACALVFEISGEPVFRAGADSCLNRLDTSYRDILRGGYTERNLKDSSDYAAALIWRTKSVQDTSEPASNGLIALAFERMALLTGDAKYLDRARTAVANFGGLLENPSVYNGTLAVAAEGLEHAVTKVTLLPGEDEGENRAWANAASAGYSPWICVLRGERAERASATVSRGGETKVVRTVAELVKELGR